MKALKRWKVFCHGVQHGARITERLLCLNDHGDKPDAAHTMYILIARKSLCRRQIAVASGVEQGDMRGLLNVFIGAADA